MAPRKPLSPATADRLERMARQSVQPIKPSAAIPTSAKPKNWWDDEPSPAANVPGNKPFVGPTLDPEVLAARANLQAKGYEAIAAGVPASRVEPIVAGEGDPNRGFIGLGKDILGLGKKVGGAVIPDVLDVSDIPLPWTDKNLGQVVAPIAKGAVTKGLGTLAGPASTLDIGRRLITSSIKELGDELSVWRGTRQRGVDKGGWRGAGGFSFEDFVNQTFAGTLGIGTPEQGIGGGEFFQDVKNPYLNQLYGFVADVLLDPLTYATGPGGIFKTGASRGVLAGGTKVGARQLERFVANQADLANAALKIKLGEEALDAAVRVGDDFAAEAARASIKQAEIQSAKAAKAASGDAATRVLGRASNQALAESVLQVRDDAQRFVDQADEIIGAPARGARVTDVVKELQDEIDLATSGLNPIGEFTPGGLAARVEQAGLDVNTFAAQYADAVRAVEILTPQVIKNIQTSGLAGIAGSFVDILKGVRTPAQEVLGVRGGVRVYNPLELFGKGPTRVIVPGTERVLNATGKLLAESRLGIGRTPFGLTLLDNVVLAGEGGLLGSADLLELRKNLRAGTLNPAEAQEATRLLALDSRYRALVSNERKVAGSQLSKSGVAKMDRATLNSVLPYLQSDPASWAGRLPPMNTAQQVAYDAVKKQLEDFYVYAARASGATGFVPPKRSNYFPQMQSQKSLRWAQRNPKQAEELAKALNVDRTWFVGNFRARELAAGDTWFGKVLTDDDIAQGVVRLNEIAKASGRIDFDFFETDVLEALNKYANKHAQFSALQKAIGSIPEQFPELGVRTDGGIGTTTVRGTERPVFLAVGEDAFNDLLNPNNLLTATPDQLRDALAATRRVVEQLDRPTVIKERVVQEIEYLNKQLDDIATAAAIAPPGAVAVATDEVKQLARNLVDEAKGAQRNFLGVPPQRWATYVDIVDSGFVTLNQFTAPDIAAKAEIAELFQNASRMGDVEFARRAKQLISDYTNFSKSWLVMRPGFHIRNAISNAFQFIAAGGDPIVGVQGVKIQNAVEEGLKAGKTVRQIATEIVDEGELIKIGDKGTRRLTGPFVRPGAEQALARTEAIDSITEAINYLGSTGFGQYGEIAETLGTGRRGFLGVGAPTQKPVVGQVSSALGAVVKGNRKLGQLIENPFRFGLMWDGLMKGLSPQQAAARVNKYLIDYQDLSKADKIARQVIPFWTFMSRNAPLQLEMMLTNPKAYAWYNSAKRNFAGPTEAEGGIVVPEYEKERGTFALRTPIDFNIPDVFPFLPDRFQANVIRPGLPFEGGGESTLTTLITDPKKVLKDINPLFRAPVEALVTGKSMFTGAPIVPAEQADQPTGAKVRYLIKELFSPFSPLRSVVAFVPAEQRPQFLNDLLGLKVDDDQAAIQELSALLSWGGIPLGNIRTQQQVKALESRGYKLGELIDAKRKQQQKQFEQESNQPQEPGKNWWED